MLRIRAACSFASVKESKPPCGLLAGESGSSGVIRAGIVAHDLHVQHVGIFRILIPLDSGQFRFELVVVNLANDLIRFTTPIPLPRVGVSSSRARLSPRGPRGPPISDSKTNSSGLAETSTSTLDFAVNPPRSSAS